LPNQVLQRESVAAILDFGLPGSVVLERASLLSMRLVESEFRALSMTVPLWQDSEAKFVPRKKDLA
jgi:hypothetical protein